jgi:hypothetical protein
MYERFLRFFVFGNGKGQKMPVNLQKNERGEGSVCTKKSMKVKIFGGNVGPF